MNLALCFPFEILLTYELLHNNISLIIRGDTDGKAFALPFLR
nr:MAG TPA: hypothetical protein [Caudoviricetes sp.]